MKVFSKCLVLFLVLSANLYADVKMPSFFSDNMVLQRDIPLNVWGWALPGEGVMVTFAGQTVSSTADNEGKWAIKLAPLKLNQEAQEMTVSGKNKLSFKNVLVGDVWVCSGQSNMQMMVSNAANAKEEIASSKNPLIRHISIPFGSISLYPKDDIFTPPWVVSGPDATGKFTAVGYYFAREIVKETGVPTGLIHVSWGGTKIEPWTPAEGFRKVPELKIISEQVDSWIPTTEIGKKAFLKYIGELKAWIPTAETDLKKGVMPPALPPAPGVANTFHSPTMIFNGMVNPLLKYGIKGVIWYQGEANESEDYGHKMNALISSWRSLWKQPPPSATANSGAPGVDFPFYYVQLPNNRASSLDNPAGGEVFTKTREEQLKTMSVVPNTGMAVIIDIGDADDIHPKNKQDVGKRLAAWALAKDYGKNIVYSGPLYKEFKVEGNRIRISFDHIGSGLIAGKKEGLLPVKETTDEKLKWFAMAGEDKKWYWADAVIDGSTVLVSSEKVQKPIAVRYAFRMNPDGVKLYNKEGFPASPFRTDNW